MLQYKGIHEWNFSATSVRGVRSVPPTTLPHTHTPIIGKVSSRTLCSVSTPTCFSLYGLCAVGITTHVISTGSYGVVFHRSFFVPRASVTTYAMCLHRNRWRCKYLHLPGVFTAPSTSPESSPRPPEEFSVRSEGCARTLLGNRSFCEPTQPADTAQLVSSVSAGSCGCSLLFTQFVSDSYVNSFLPVSSQHLQV